MSATPIQDAAGAATLAQVIAHGVRAVYQPIVDLETGELVAYEALARGPAGSPFESPAALFSAARHEGRVEELDWACRIAALRGALDGALRPPVALFLNVEPDMLGSPPDRRTAQLLERASRGLNVFAEVTERSLMLHPARLLESVEALRAAGWGIALDDVGGDPRSLALLPLLRPDVIKLDVSLVHQHPSPASGQIMSGVCAYAERTGAAILAEGLENEQHLIAAQSLGASLGQGWHFGRPSPLPVPAVDIQRAAHVRRAVNIPSRAVRLESASRFPSYSPVELLVHAGRVLRIGRKEILLSVSRALEAQALDLGGHAVVIGAFQHVRHLTSATRARYVALAHRSAFTAALGVGMPDPPLPGVRGAWLDAHDPLRGEWDLAVLGPHFAGALVARDLGDQGADRNRRFEFALTFDRDLVIEVTASLMARVSAQTAGTRLSLAA